MDGPKFTDLPIEIFDEVCLCLPRRSLHALSLVSKGCDQAVRASSHWRKACHSHQAYLGMVVARPCNLTTDPTCTDEDTREWFEVWARANDWKSALTTQAHFVDSLLHSHVGLPYECIGSLLDNKVISIDMPLLQKQTLGLIGCGLDVISQGGHKKTLYQLIYFTLSQACTTFNTKVFFVITDNMLLLHVVELSKSIGVDHLVQNIHGATKINKSAHVYVGWPDDFRKFDESFYKPSIACIVAEFDRGLYLHRNDGFDEESVEDSCEDPVEAKEESDRKLTEFVVELVTELKATTGTKPQVLLNCVHASVYTLALAAQAMTSPVRVTIRGDELLLSKVKMFRELIQSNEYLNEATTSIAIASQAKRIAIFTNTEERSRDLEEYMQNCGYDPLRVTVYDMEEMTSAVLAGRIVIATETLARVDGWAESAGNVGFELIMHVDLPRSVDELLSRLGHTLVYGERCVSVIVTHERHLNVIYRMRSEIDHDISPLPNDFNMAKNTYTPMTWR